MEELLARLTAIHHFSKTLHYNCSGSSAYADHLLADKIGDDLDEHKDSINEVCYLGKEMDTPLSKDILAEAITYIPNEHKDIETLMKEIDDLIVGTLDHIQNIMETKEDLTVGEENLLGGIAEDLQLKHGLLYLRLKSVKE